MDRNQTRLMLKMCLTLVDLTDSFYAPKFGLLITIFHTKKKSYPEPGFLLKLNLLLAG